MRAVKRTVALLALASHLVASFPGAALAQGEPPPAEAADAAARARDLKARGDAAIGEMRYTEALEAYEEAYRLSPTWEVLFNRGRAHQFLGHFPEALADFERFAADAPPAIRSKVPGIDRIVADVRAQVTYLTVRSAVPGATVVLGDRVLGATPLPARIGVASGKATLRATAPGHEPWERSVDLAGGGRELQIELVLAPIGDGILRIESGTKGAVALVDGRRIGAVPVDVPAKPGEHVVTLEREDHETASQRARVAAGATHLVRFDLVEEPGLHERWWFWAGVGLVVAGGVATAIIVTQEKEPPAGDFSPGQFGVASARPLLSF
jgi:hypothetical protein